MWNDNNNNNIFNLPYHILWLLGVLSETQVWTGRVADLMLIPNMHYPATSEAEALPPPPPFQPLFADATEACKLVRQSE